MRILLPLCLGIALLCSCSGADKKKPPIGVSAVRFTIGTNPALEIRVTDRWVMVGRRGIVKSKDGVSGTVDRRFTKEELARKKIKVRPLARWKLERQGDMLVGKVAGQTARIKVTRKGKDLEMDGQVGGSPVKVVQKHYSLRITAQDTTMDFGLELSGSTGGGRIWMASDGCCRLSVSESVLRRTGTDPEIAMLVLALELSGQNQMVDDKVHPGWEDELSDEKKKK